MAWGGLPVLASRHRLRNQVIPEPPETEPRTMALAVAAAPLPVVLAHPLASLMASGIDVHQLGLDRLAPLGEASLRVGAVVEVNEECRAPDEQVARWFSQVGVPLVPCSDALDVAQVGRFDHVNRCLDVAARLAV
jgi:hypothetical protein